MNIDMENVYILMELISQLSVSLNVTWILVSVNITADYMLKLCIRS